MVVSPDRTQGSEGFSADYFAQLVQLEEDSFWFQSRNRLLTWALGRYFPRARSLLEIGCGTGFVLSAIQRRFPKLRLSGSDLFDEGLALAQKRLPGVTLHQLDASHIPFKAEFDVVGAFDVLEHIKDDAAALQQMFQAAKPGGGVILTVPQHRFLWSSVDEYSFHERRYTRTQLRKKVERAGFNVRRITSFVSLLLPLMLVSRARHRTSHACTDPLAEYRIGSRLSAVLEKVMTVERVLIRAGLSFPAGGSLLLVAGRPGR